uniref:Uncharacterized protein n=1 Tax=Mus spicilegus TaxID=10103 RepID=A0A8C6GJI5_MUSSI
MGLFSSCCLDFSDQYNNVTHSARYSLDLCSWNMTHNAFTVLIPIGYGIHMHQMTITFFYISDQSHSEYPAIKKQKQRRWTNASKNRVEQQGFCVLVRKLQESKARVLQNTDLVQMGVSLPQLLLVTCFCGKPIFCHMWLVLMIEHLTHAILNPQSINYLMF